MNRAEKTRYQLMTEEEVILVANSASTIITGIQVELEGIFHCAHLVWWESGSAEDEGDDEVFIALGAVFPSGYYENGTSLQSIAVDWVEDGCPS